MEENSEIQITQEETESETLLKETEEQENLTPSVAPKKDKFFIGGGLYNFLLIFGAMFLVSLYFFQIFLSPIKVVGKSMQPTINVSVLSDEDSEHCDIVYYRNYDHYSNDDIVIVSNKDDKYVESADPNKPVEYLIKRIIACPGQTITFFVTDIDFDLSLELNHTYYYDVSVKDPNGNTILLDTSYITEPMKFTRYEFLACQMLNNNFAKIFKNLAESTATEYKQYSFTVNQDEYFVMGDNRNNSRDSRYFGCVSTNYISGKVELQVPYGSNIWVALWGKFKEQLS